MTTLVIIIIFSAFAAVGVALWQSRPDHDNKDPRNGRVYTDTYDYKYCDGTTLIYHLDDNDSGTVLPNAPECAN